MTPIPPITAPIADVTDEAQFPELALARAHVEANPELKARADAEWRNM